MFRGGSFLYVWKVNLISFIFYMKVYSVGIESLRDWYGYFGKKSQHFVLFEVKSQEY